MARNKSKHGRSAAKSKPALKPKAKSKGLRAGRSRVGSKLRARSKVRTAGGRARRRAVTGGQAPAQRLAHNKKLVLEFYQKLIGEKDFEAARPYMGSSYRQHAPYAGDGHEGVAEWLRKFKEAFPQHHYEVKKVIAEGDFVVLHLHGKSGLHPFGESVVDIFRIEDGKVVEHWDVIQAIPETADNANSMF